MDKLSTTLSQRCYHPMLKRVVKLIVDQPGYKLMEALKRGVDKSAMFKESSLCA